MFDELLSLTSQPPGSCVIELDGAEIGDMYPALVSVEIVLDRHRFGEATLVFESRRLEDGLWTVQDDARFLPWVTCRIEAVFGEERQEVMRGYVRQVKAAYPRERGTATVTLICQDESLALDRAWRDTHWGEEETPVTDGAMATRIAEHHGLGLLATPGEGLTLVDVNQNDTDLRFLDKRARENRYELIFRAGQLYFGPMRLDEATQPTILIYAGPDTTCLSFEVDDDGHHPDGIAYEVSAASGSDSQPQSLAPQQRQLGARAADSSGAGLEPFVWRPARTGQSDATRMRAISQQAANEEAMRIRVDGELDGARYEHVLLPGAPVGIDGAGERYSGTWYVDAVTHRFDVQGYTQRFRLLRNAYGDDLQPVSQRLAGAI